MTRSRVLACLVAVLVLMLSSATSTLALESHSGAAPTTEDCFLNITIIGCGTVTRHPATGCGVVEINVVPCGGWRFIGWSGDFSGSANPISFYLAGSKSITANLALNSCTLDVTVLGGGTVARSPDLPSYYHGAIVELTASPAPGDAFAGWSGDASGTSNPLMVVMDGDKSITASFGLLGAPDRGATELALGAISPTPTSGPARIAFALPREARVRLSVLDLQGREVATVADATYPAGSHEAAWSGRGARGAMPAGVYLVRMQTLGRAFVGRVVLTR